MPEITGGHHVAFTVTDVERSKAWYTDLLGMVEVFGGDDETVSFRVLAHPGSGFVIGLRQYHQKPGDGFDEFRTGLDHFALGVSSREQLEAWQAELERRGNVTYTPITDTPIGSVIVFRDPDGIQLEFWLGAG